MTVSDCPTDIELRRSRAILSSLCEIGLDQLTQLCRDLWLSAEPQLEAAHRLMQEHAEPVGGLQTTRLRRRKQRRHQGDIDEIGDDGRLRQPCHINIE